MSEVPLRGFRGGRILVALVLGLGFTLLLTRWAAGLYVELLWFSTEGFSGVFWRQTFWTWGVRVAAGLIAGSLIYLNLRIVADTLGGIQIRRKFGDLEIQEQLPDHYVRLAVLAAAVFVGFWFGASVPGEAGYRALLLFHGPSWGSADPFMGQDFSHYVFQLPVLSGLVTFGLVLAFFLFVVSAGGYLATGAVRWRRNRLEMDGLSMPHLASLASLFLLLLAVRYALARHFLLLDGNSGVQGIFGYADAMARMPGYSVVAVLGVAGAVGIFWGGLRRNLLPPVAGIAVFALGAIVMGEIYPQVVQRFRVQPNELARETAYIDANIAHTRDGFGLEGLDRQRYPYTPPGPEDWEVAVERMAGFPIWTQETLLTSFRQVEARFRYYDFPEVTVDRYVADGGRELPVAISVREIDPNGIPDPNWQNLHLRERYVAGMGAVAADATSHTPDGRLDMLLFGIPPTTSGNNGVTDALRLDHNSVFVGARPQLHAILNPTDEDFLAPDGTRGEPGVDFPAGIELRTLPRTLALAWRFQDANILFASEVQSTSRFVFRRHVLERLQALAPFLLYLEAPYPVVMDGRIVWVVEGFTHSRHFPLSAAHDPGTGRPVNYIRNSVKATVDAVTGEANLYITDAEDPIVRGYDRAFPGLFRALDEAPAAVLDHFRYSRELLTLQSVVLTRYHQDVPPVFHGQQDRWELATKLGAGGQTVTYRPEYAVFRLPGDEEESFLLSTILVPAGRRNLAAFLAARWSPEAGSEAYLYDVPVADQVAGPRQVEALAEQDPEISQQFALWRQAGSQVWTGHLHLVPVGTTLLYMESVFLAADEDAIPEVRRYIVSDGRRVEMATTLEGAVNALTSTGILATLPVLDDEAPAAPASALDPSPQSREALELLEEAEQRLRAGDWEGFGRALAELRTALSRLAETEGG